MDRAAEAPPGRNRAGAAPPGRNSWPERLLRGGTGRVPGVSPPRHITERTVKCCQSQRTAAGRLTAAAPPETRSHTMSYTSRRPSPVRRQSAARPEKNDQQRHRRSIFDVRIDEGRRLRKYVRCHEMDERNGSFWKCE